MHRIGALLLLVTTVSGCGTQQGTPEPIDTQLAAQVKDGESQEPKASPRLWLDEDAAGMIKVMSGYSDPEDKVYVIRWEHSEMRGQAQLESGDDSKPLSYDLGPPSDLTYRPNAEDVSGWLVVAMRKLSDTDGEKYDVRIEEQCTTRNGSESQTRGFDSRRGTLLRVPPDADREDWKIRKLMDYGNDHVELMKWQDGKSVSWLQLRLGTTSRIQSNAEPKHAGERG